MRIYLEVDGVINALQAPNLWGQKTFDSITFDGFVFVWSTEAVQKILEVCDRLDAELVWVTGWSENIPELARLLGFGHVGAEARVLEDVGIGSTPFEKADALLRDLEENPVGVNSGWVWLDSASDDVMQSNEYVQRMMVENGYVPPVSEIVGITPALLEYIVLSGSRRQR